MKISMEHAGAVYSAQENVETLSDALELIERLLICAGFSVEIGSLDVKEKP